MPRHKMRVYANGGVQQKRILGFKYGPESWIIPDPTHGIGAIDTAILREICAEKFAGEDVIVHFAMLCDNPRLSGKTFHMRWSLTTLEHTVGDCGTLSPRDMQLHQPSLAHYFIINQARNRGSNQWKLKRVIFDRKEKARHNPCADLR